jgi:hypothetical protein
MEREVAIMAVSTLNEQGAILMKEKNAWFSVLILVHGVCGKNKIFLFLRPFLPFWILIQSGSGSATL